MSAHGFSDEDLERGRATKGQAKARPRGTLPYLPDDRSLEIRRAWLTRALRPPSGWTVHNFERAGREPTDPCSITIMNGREHRTYRFTQQRDVAKNPRPTIASITDGDLAVPHLTSTEVEDVWMALCQLGQVMTEHDDREVWREHIESMLTATMPLVGHTLVPDGRHEALMALRHAGEFTKPDALSLSRQGDDRYQRRPCRFIDSQTGEQWLRSGETATYLRWVLGVEPLSHSTLKSRLGEIGMVGRVFEDYRPPHPKLQLYQLTESLIETVGGGEVEW